MGCSFTGHRTIQIKHRLNIKEAIARHIDMAYNEGCRDFYSGAAIGFDTLAAFEVLNYKKIHSDVRLILLIPCIDQDSKWNEEQRNDYKKLLMLADDVIYVSDSPYYDGCMQKRNRELVERCKILIAYVGRERGGSAQTYRMAERNGRRIYNIFPLLS